MKMNVVKPPDECCPLTSQTHSTPQGYRSLVIASYVIVHFSVLNNNNEETSETEVLL